MFVCLLLLFFCSFEEGEGESITNNMQTHDRFWLFPFPLHEKLVMF